MNITTLMLVKEYIDEAIKNIGSGSIAVIDNLTSTSAKDALSAKQGKVLNDTKVDKVDGKSLISNEEITRLSSVRNYDDAEIRRLISELTSRVDELENPTA